MLRFTDFNLNVISGIENLQFIKSTVRVGVSMICKGYVEANNKFLKYYDANEPSYMISKTSYIICLDANSLYGHSMKQVLPLEILDSVDPKDFSLDYYSNDFSIGRFLEVDLDYPDELHDLHDDYIFEGVKIKVTEQMLPKYQLQIIEENNYL